MGLTLATFFMVFLMSFQQQNVIHKHYIMAVFTSFAIAVAQFSLYKGIILASYSAIFFMGIGGAMGVTLSMFLHRKWFSKNEKEVVK